MPNRVIGLLLLSGLAVVAVPSPVPAAAQQGDEGGAVTDGDRIPPRLIPSSHTRPAYPEEARRLGLEGHVTIRVIVRKDGSVDAVTVVNIVVRKAISPAEGTTVDPDDVHGFGAAATAAVKTWEYEPATLNGEPFDVPVTLMVDFDPGAAGSGPFEAGRGGVTNPILHPDSKQPPRYPEAARRKRVEGRSVLQALILKDGTVDAITVLSTKLEYEDGSEQVVEFPEDPEDDFGFGAASVAAVRTWKYDPATRGGVAVDVYFTILVKFVLEPPRSGPAAPPTPT